jgi:hypothetical protein
MSTADILTKYSHYKGTQGKILEMLGAGLAPEIVATAAGVTPSYISQMLSQEEFATAVTALRFENLQAATARDRKYDDLEDALITKLQDVLPMMYKPHEILNALRVINNATRRGAAAPENVTINNTVVNLNIPAPILQRFTKDANNQVVEAGAQALVTMPSGQLLKTASSLKLPAPAATATPAAPHVPDTKDNTEVQDVQSGRSIGNSAETALTGT